MVSAPVIALIVFIVIIFIVVIGVIIYFLVRRPKTDELELEDMLGDNPTILINLMSNQSNGHAILAEAKVAGVYGGLVGESYSYCFPRDVFVVKDGVGYKGGERSKRVMEILTQAGCRHVFPKGSLSAHRDIVILSPRTAEELPVGLKKTLLGRALELDIAINETIQPIIAAYREGEKTKAEIMEQINTGEISAMLMNKAEGILKQSMKITTESQLALLEQGKPQKPMSKEGMQ